MATKSTRKIPQPPRQDAGRLPGFGRAMEIRPGACPTCGAIPACDELADQPPDRVPVDEAR